MAKPTVEDFHGEYFGRTTLGVQFAVAGDAAISAYIDIAWRDFRDGGRGTIMLAAHLLSLGLDAVDDSATGGNAVDLGSGAGLITDEQDGGGKRTLYRQAARKDDPMDAHLLTTPYGREFHRIRGTSARRRYVSFV